ncbi:hypothetical protein ES319_A09G086500v1 [Gossypium barbadense]|uniref:Uncharacterized protein n=1 Tax=Gossypium barbadense TaxID=3634 RepID=A0A5J5UCG8_GOSBA|nr:hypothetical protein ES319_A09G086500v1 [Gossypium barbadense]
MDNNVWRLIDNNFGKLFPANLNALKSKPLIRACCCIISSVQSLSFCLAGAALSHANCFDCIICPFSIGHIVVTDKWANLDEYEGSYDWGILGEPTSSDLGAFVTTFVSPDLDNSFKNCKCPTQSFLRQIFYL